MPSKVGDLHELPVAVSTTVRFLPSVQSHMGLQMVVACEPFVANLTFKWFFACMSALVILQYMLVAKTSVASLASEDFVFSVVRGSAP